MKYFSFLFSTCFIPFIFSTQKAVAERVPGERRLKLMTSHVYRHHGASKAWQNDRSCLQYVLTNKLVRRCFALHNRCGGCRGTEQPTEKRETTAPHLDQWGPSGPLIPNWTKETGRAARVTMTGGNVRGPSVNYFCENSSLSSFLWRSTVDTFCHFWHFTLNHFCWNNKCFFPHKFCTFARFQKLHF